MTRRRYTLAEYQAEADSLAEKTGDVPFVCVRCATVQSARSFVRLAPRLERDLDAVIGFSCIGRWVPRLGCDWTCGGLLRDLGKGVSVVTDDGKEHLRFPFGTRAEADRLLAASSEPFVRSVAPASAVPTSDDTQLALTRLETVTEGGTS